MGIEIVRTTGDRNSWRGVFGQLATEIPGGEHTHKHNPHTNGTHTQTEPTHKRNYVHPKGLMTAKHGLSAFRCIDGDAGTLGSASVSFIGILEPSDALPDGACWWCLLRAICTKAL